MKNKRTVKIGAVWALTAFAAAAASHFADAPERGQAWFDAIERVRPLKKLPTWALREVAKAAAERPFQTRRYKTIASGLLTEFERRRADRAAKEEAEHASV